MQARFKLSAYKLLSLQTKTRPIAGGEQEAAKEVTVIEGSWYARQQLKPRHTDVANT